MAKFRFSRRAEADLLSIADFLQSSVQGISLQTSLGGGVGRYLKNTNRRSISVLGGVVWQNTRYQQSAVSGNTQNLAAGLLYANANFFRFSKTNLNVTAGLLPAISDPGRVHFNTNVTYLRQTTTEPVRKRIPEALKRVFPRTGTGPRMV